MIEPFFLWGLREYTRHGDMIVFLGHALFARAWNSRDKAMFREALAHLAGVGL
jgi:hypothetical protein